MGLIEIENIWRFIGGLGIFLISMKFVEESLSDLAGRRFKRFFREYTKTPLRGILGGTLATVVLQSSSVVTLMVLSFVGAGVIDMKSALGVVFGSNLGTTFTGWVVASLGFKVDVLEFAFPLIGVGSIFYTLLPKEQKLAQIFRFLAGLGLLFFGLELMKQAMEGVSQKFDVSVLHGYGMVSYFLFGYVFTAIVQSSSATMMTTLAALHAGILNLPLAAALIIGADLGTTTTALLASIGASPGKKQTSMAHFLFNFVTDVVALILISPLLSFVLKVFGPGEPLLSLVFFHSLFNFIGIIVFIPFTGVFAGFLEKYIGRTEKKLTTYIQRVNPSMTEAALEALNREVLLLIDRVVEFNRQAFSLKFLKGSFSFVYEEMKELVAENLSYALRIQSQPVSEEDSKRLGQILKALDYFAKSSKSAKDIHHNIKDFEGSGQNEIIHFLWVLQEDIKKSFQIINEVKKFENQSHVFEELLAVKNKNIRDYEERQKMIYGNLKERKYSESTTGTLLNVNREVHASMESLIFALKEILLPREKAEEI
ncbi:MAG: Na/Pi cotransporter family protein [Bdellovibrionales bacterium]|nr:Na/Pi cotransporter family protein [Bdellovibrionales bacterium]